MGHLHLLQCECFHYAICPRIFYWQNIFKLCSEIVQKERVKVMVQVKYENVDGITNLNKRIYRLI